MNGVPSCADGDEAAGQRLVLGIKPDECRQLLFHFVQPVMDGLLLLQQRIRLGVLKGLLDLLQFGVKLDLKSTNSAGAPISRGLNPAATVEWRHSPVPG